MEGSVIVGRVERPKQRRKTVSRQTPRGTLQSYNDTTVSDNNRVFSDGARAFGDIGVTPSVFLGPEYAAVFVARGIHRLGDLVIAMTAFGNKIRKKRIHRVAISQKHYS